MATATGWHADGVIGERIGGLGMATGTTTSVARALVLATTLAVGASACLPGWDRPGCSGARARCDVTWSATVTGERKVSLLYRQGLARVRAGWIFTFNNALFRTDDDLVESTVHANAIPADLTAAGYDHIGDPDIGGGYLWVPLEQPTYANGIQRTARYDPVTLQYVDSIEVPQHHNAFVAVEHGILYSADQFSDDALVRYRIAGDRLVPLRPLPMSRTVEDIQGADIWAGAAWLSTDDDHNGVYRVDLRTGEVTDVGSSGHIAGEGEGIDATPLPSGQLHTLTGDETSLDMWLVDLQVRCQRRTPATGGA